MALALLAGAGPVCAGSPAHAADPATVRIGSVDVPVLGRVLSNDVGVSGNNPAQGVITVHGVRRVGQATVLYFSVGVPAGATANYASSFEGVPLPNDPPEGYAQYLLDPERGKGYSVLTGTTGVVATQKGMLQNVAPGQATVMFTVFPALPPQVQRVDVVLGHKRVVPGVPVQDGALEPAVGSPDGSHVPLGTGWPAIDPAIGDGADQQSSIFTLTATSKALDNTATTRKRAERTTVDLAADVLFAVDSAKLTAKAGKALDRLARQIKQSAVSGSRIEIVGHTDSTGSPSHNLTLSKARAASVEKALRARLGGTGVSFVVSGKGETQPVAPNDTAEGRQANRRVSVEYTEKQS